MCNAYRIGRAGDRLPPCELRGIFATLVDDELPRLVLRTDRAPVLTASMELVKMRWGFERARRGTINHTRAEKLRSRMWVKAFHERRCLIPATAYYEWSGPPGRKRTHLFSRRDGATLWIAGIWEPSTELGPCFSMITTRANSLVVPVQDRMPAILEEDQLAAYLAGGISEFEPLAESLQVEDAPDPLSNPKGQGEVL